MEQNEQNTNGVAKTGTTSVIHADPHPLLRFGVKLLLNSKAECSYVAECSSAEETLSKVQELKPDLLILELALSDKSGIEVIRKLRKEKEQVKILVLSGFEDEATVRQALHAGADGYLFKSSSADKILAAVSAAKQSAQLVLPEGLIHLRDHKSVATNGKSKNGHFNADPLAQLSKREREVFYLLAEGHPNRIIAKQLFISPRTVETHRARVIKKLGFDNTADLIRYAIRNNLMPL